MKEMLHDQPGEARELEPLDSMRTFAQGWSRFWFTPADPTTLGFIRLCIGFVVLYTHICYSFDLLSYVSPKQAWIDASALDYIRNKTPVMTMPDEFPNPDQGQGVYVPVMRDAENPLTGQPTFSVYFHLEKPADIWTAHILILIAMFLFMIGFGTRVTSVLTLLGALCYVHRAQTSFFGQDSMVCLLLFYMMLAPCGAAVSIDRLLEIRRERKRLGDPNADVPLQPSVSANFVTRMIQIHFCLIYLAAGTCKLLGASWWNGTALWDCYANYSFSPMRVPIYRNTLLFLTKHRWLWEIVMSGGVVFTLFTELSLPYLIWFPRWRWVMISCSVLLHTGIGLSMGLVTFSLAMLCLVMAFVPPETTRIFLDGIVERLKRWKAALYGAAAPAQPAPAAAH
jgi:hypothetical protein